MIEPFQLLERHMDRAAGREVLGRLDRQSRQWWFARYCLSG